MNLLGMIPVGNKNPIPMKTLKLVTGMGERPIRKRIEILKKDYPIVNCMDGRGYFIATTVKEAVGQKRRTLNRATSLLAQFKPLDRVIQQASGQTEIDEHLVDLLDEDREV